MSISATSLVFLVIPALAASKAPTDIDTFALEEVVVTAQKRKETLQDVPVWRSARDGRARHVIPEMRLGVVVLVNQQAPEAANAITLHVAKAYVGTGQQDWVAMFKAASDQERAQIAAVEAELRTAIAKAGRPPLSASADVGTYRDAWRGIAAIQRKGNVLTLTFSRTQRMSGALDHYRNGVFVVRRKDRSFNGDAFVYFTRSSSGSIEGMTMQGLPMSESGFDVQDLELRKVQTGAVGQ